MTRDLKPCSSRALRYYLGAVMMCSVSTLASTVAYAGAKEDLIAIKDITEGFCKEIPVLCSPGDMWHSESDMSTRQFGNALQQTLVFHKDISRDCGDGKFSACREALKRDIIAHHHLRDYRTYYKTPLQDMLAANVGAPWNDYVAALSQDAVAYKEFLKQAEGKMTALRSNLASSGAGKIPAKEENDKTKVPTPLATPQDLEEVKALKVSLPEKERILKAAREAFEREYSDEGLTSYLAALDDLQAEYSNLKEKPTVLALIQSSFLTENIDTLLKTLGDERTRVEDFRNKLSPMQSRFITSWLSIISAEGRFERTEIDLSGLKAYFDSFEKQFAEIVKDRSVARALEQRLAKQTLPEKGFTTLEALWANLELRYKTHCEQWRRRFSTAINKLWQEYDDYVKNNPTDVSAQAAKLIAVKTFYDSHSAFNELKDLILAEQKHYIEELSKVDARKPSSVSPDKSAVFTSWREGLSNIAAAIKQAVDTESIAAAEAALAAQRDILERDEAHLLGHVRDDKTPVTKEHLTSEINQLAEQLKTKEVTFYRGIVDKVYADYSAKVQDFAQNGNYAELDKVLTAAQQALEKVPADPKVRAAVVEQLGNILDVKSLEAAKTRLTEVREHAKKHYVLAFTKLLDTLWDAYKASRTQQPIHFDEQRAHLVKIKNYVENQLHDPFRSALAQDHLKQYDQELALITKDEQKHAAMTGGYATWTKGIEALKSAIEKTRSAESIVAAEAVLATQRTMLERDKAHLVGHVLANGAAVTEDALASELVQLAALLKDKKIAFYDAIVDRAYSEYHAKTQQYNNGDYIINDYEVDLAQLSQNLESDLSAVDGAFLAELDKARENKQQLTLTALRKEILDARKTAQQDYVNVSAEEFWDEYLKATEQTPFNFEDAREKLEELEDYLAEAEDYDESAYTQARAKYTPLIAKAHKEIQEREDESLRQQKLELYNTFASKFEDAQKAVAAAPDAKACEELLASLTSLRGDFTRIGKDIDGLVLSKEEGNQTVSIDQLHQQIDSLIAVNSQKKLAFEGREHWEYLKTLMDALPEMQQEMSRNVVTKAAQSYQMYVAALENALSADQPIHQALLAAEVSMDDLRSRLGEVRTLSTKLDQLSEGCTYLAEMEQSIKKLPQIIITYPEGEEESLEDALKRFDASVTKARFLLDEMKNPKNAVTTMAETALAIGVSTFSDVPTYDSLRQEVEAYLTAAKAASAKSLADALLKSPYGTLDELENTLKIEKLDDKTKERLRIHADLVESSFPQIAARGIALEVEKHISGRPMTSVKETVTAWKNKHGMKWYENPLTWVLGAVGVTGLTIVTLKNSCHGRDADAHNDAEASRGPRNSASGSGSGASTSSATPVVKPENKNAHNGGSSNKSTSKKRKNNSHHQGKKKNADSNLDGSISEESHVPKQLTTETVLFDVAEGREVPQPQDAASTSLSGEQAVEDVAVTSSALLSSAHAGRNADDSGAETFLSRTGSPAFSDIGADAASTSAADGANLLGSPDGGPIIVSQRGGNLRTPALGSNNSALFDQLDDSMASSIADVPPSAPVMEVYALNMSAARPEVGVPVTPSNKENVPASSLHSSSSDALNSGMMRSETLVDTSHQSLDSTLEGSPTIIASPDFLSTYDYDSDAKVQINHRPRSQNSSAAKSGRGHTGQSHQQPFRGTFGGVVVRNGELSVDRNGQFILTPTPSSKPQSEKTGTPKAKTHPLTGEKHSGKGGQRGADTKQNSPKTQQQRVDTPAPFTSSWYALGQAARSPSSVQQKARGGGGLSAPLPTVPSRTPGDVWRRKTWENMGISQSSSFAHAPEELNENPFDESGQEEYLSDHSAEFPYENPFNEDEQEEQPLFSEEDFPPLPGHEPNQHRTPTPEKGAEAAEVQSASSHSSASSAQSTGSSSQRASSGEKNRRRVEKSSPSAARRLEFPSSPEHGGMQTPAGGRNEPKLQNPAPGILNLEDRTPIFLRTRVGAAEKTPYKPEVRELWEVLRAHETPGRGALISEVYTRLRNKEHGDKNISEKQHSHDQHAGQLQKHRRGKVSRPKPNDQHIQVQEVPLPLNNAGPSGLNPLAPDVDTQSLPLQGRSKQSDAHSTKSSQSAPAGYTGRSLVNRLAQGTSDQYLQGSEKKK